MADYSLEKWYWGISWPTIKRWRHVVRCVVGEPDPVPVVLGPFPLWLPTLSVIEATACVVTTVEPEKPEAVLVVTYRNSLSLFRDYFAPPSNIVSGRVAVSCRGVNRTSLTGFRSPSRCRNNGSVRAAKPDYLALATAVGSQAVADVLAIPVSDARRLELLASMILTGKTVPQLRSEHSGLDRIGFSDCGHDTISRMQHHVVPNDEADSVLLRLIARQSACEDDRLTLAAKIEAVAESVKTGLSIAWKAGLNDEKTAELLAVSTRTVERYRRKVLDSVSGFVSKSAN